MIHHRGANEEALVDHLHKNRATMLSKMRNQVSDETWLVLQCRGFDLSTPDAMPRAKSVKLDRKSITIVNANANEGEHRLLSEIKYATCIYKIARISALVDVEIARRTCRPRLLARAAFASLGRTLQCIVQRRCNEFAQHPLGPRSPHVVR